MLEPIVFNAKERSLSGGLSHIGSCQIPSPSFPVRKYQHAGHVSLVHLFDVLLLTFPTLSLVANRYRDG